MLRFPKYKYYFVAADISIIAAAFTAAFIMNSNSREVLKTTSGIFLTLIFIFIILVFGFISESQNLYERNLILKRKEHTAAIGKVIIYLTLFTAAISFLSFSFNHIRLGLFFTFAVSAFILFYVFRIEFLRILLDKMGRKNILIIGNGETGKKLSSLLEDKNNTGINVAGKIDNFNFDGNLKSVIGKYKIDEVLLAPGIESYDEILNAVDKCRSEHISVKLISEKFKVIPDKLHMEKYYDFSVIDLTRRYPDKAFTAVKRIIDVLITIVGLLVLSPLFIVVAVIIKLTSSGPVLFKQRRIGLNGIEFDFYKFRSMTVDNGEDEERKKMMLDYMNNNKAQKIINDKRLTPIGKIIRQTSIDELPQLLNVLKGEMSLVGPRPCLPYEYENYKEWQRRRVRVLPGCTGVWQVSGRSCVTFTDSILLDLYYINKMSPLFDLKLIMKTIPVMIFSKGGK